VRLWAKPSTAFRCRTGVYRGIHVHPRSKSGEVACAPSPQSKTSPTSHGTSRIARQRFGVHDRPIGARRAFSLTVGGSRLPCPT
jgi:hypothetical protein